MALIGPPAAVKAAKTIIPRPGQSARADKLLRTKHEISVEQDAGNAWIKESHVRPSSKFHTGAKSETTHVVDPTTGKATTGTRFTRGSLTTTGRRTRNAGIAGGAVGGYAGLVHHDRKQKQKDLVAAARAVNKRDQKPLMSEAEQRRRQKLQGKIGRGTSALGLTGVALAGTGALAAKKPGMLKNIPKLKNANPEKLKDAAFHTGIISGGIGGVGGFNQASIYSAEARRRKAAPVQKDLGMDMGYFGEEVQAITHEEIETEIAKAWEPTTRQYDPEAKRHKRAKNYETGLTAAAAGTGAGAAGVGAKAWHGHGKNQRAGRAIADKLKMKNMQIVPEAGHLKAVKGGKVAAGLAGASLATGGAAALVHRQRKGSWQSYSKSAFGVAHDPNGQHRETEN